MTTTARGKSVLDQLSPASRVWVFGSSASLDDGQHELIESGLSEFLETWKAHGRPLRAGVEIRDRRFVIVAADDSGDPSGCSIDALFSRVAKFRSIGADLLDSNLVFYRSDDGSVRSVDRATFRRMVESGEVGSRTRVFDLTAGTLSEVRAGFEKPAVDSWHAQAFGL